MRGGCRAANAACDGMMRAWHRASACVVSSVQSAGSNGCPHSEAVCVHTAKACMGRGEEGEPTASTGISLEERKEENQQMGCSTMLRHAAWRLVCCGWVGEMPEAERSARPYTPTR
jgi:hypothetical protein